MIKTIEYEFHNYPAFQAEGFAAQFAIPYAKHVCKGNGYDIGPKFKEWKLPGATGIDIAWDDPWDAYSLPEGEVDYIFSSHCLEHLDDWVGALDYWQSKLVDRGVLFLYLPDYSQAYWRPWHNRKHKHYFVPQILRDFLTSRNWKNIFVSDTDLNNSFMVMAERCISWEKHIVRPQ